MARVLVVSATYFMFAVNGGAVVCRARSAMLQTMSGIVCVVVSCRTVHRSTPISLKRKWTPLSYATTRFTVKVGNLMPENESNLSPLSKFSFHNRAVHRQRPGAERSQK